MATPWRPMYKMSCDTVLSELRHLTGIRLACSGTLEESKCLSAAHNGGCRDIIGDAKWIADHCDRRHPQHSGAVTNRH